MGLESPRRKLVIINGLLFLDLSRVDVMLMRIQFLLQWLINPVIKPLSKEMEDGWEGCLSVPGLRGLVPRYTHIEYSGFDAEGKPFSREVKGFHARVVQHEVDHLDGILYPHRIKDLRFFGFLDAFAIN